MPRNSLALLVFAFCAALTLALPARAADGLLGADFTQDSRAYYPPKGIPMKGANWTLISDKPDKSGKNAKYPIFGTDRKLTKEGYYYYKLATDPEWFKQHLQYALSGDGWKEVDTPVYKGTVNGYQSIVHRMTGVLKSFAGTVRSAKFVDPDFKKAVFSPEWRVGTEKVMRDMLNERGLLAYQNNEYPMAQAFHLIRSGLQSGKDKGDFLREEEVWHLEQAQRLIRSILTDPDICSPEDRWLDASDKYIESKKSASSAGEDGANDNSDAKSNDNKDRILIKDGKVFYSGGLFIGWKESHPSLHGSWDGMAIINILYSHYPEPDPQNPQSLFYLWGKQSPEKRELGIRLMKTLRARLWMDYYTKGGPTYCRVYEGKVTGDMAAPNQAEAITDHAGYSLPDVTHWANLCWQEMFGAPKGPNYEGVQAFLAICDGKIWNPAMKGDIEKLRIAPKRPK